MNTEVELTEYLDEMRRQVCSHCVERPAGGPPCAPLGKNCGVEMHLPQLIESIHQVKSVMLEPYLQHNRKDICEKCAFLYTSICPCPMDYLSVLVVQAVETVDQRHQERQKENTLPLSKQINPAVACCAVERTAASHPDCDWPRKFE
jgi:hypothetical protein